MGLQIIGESGSGAKVADVNANNELKVALAASQVNAGFAALATEQGAAAEPSGTRKVRRLKASLNRRLSVGMDTTLRRENFIAAAQHTGLWRHGTTTFVAPSFATPGFVVFNPGSVVTSGAAQYLQSYQHFVLGGQNPITLDLPFLISAAPPADWQQDFGFAALTTTPFTFTDGVYCRLNSTGLHVVLNYAGTETVALMLAAADIVRNVVYTARLVIGSERTEAWINDPNGDLGTPDASSFAYLGAIDTPPANPYPCAQLSQPISYRLFHSATAGAAVQFRFGGPSVTEGDTGQNRSMESTLTRMGLHGSQGQNGHTMGSTALLTNSLAAGAGLAMTNTTAALGVGLGGQFACQPTLAAGTDGIVCSFLNPLPTNAIQGRTLIIRGVRVQCGVTTVLVGGPLLYEYSLAYGHTSLSMATAEGIAAKAPRRIPLGLESIAVTAAVGTIGQSVYVPLVNEVAVNPGEYVALCAKNLGVVTSSGVVVFCVFIDARWE